MLLLLLVCVDCVVVCLYVDTAVFGCVSLCLWVSSFVRLFVSLSVRFLFVSFASLPVWCSCLLVYSKLLNRASGRISQTPYFSIGFLEILPEALLSTLEYLLGGLSVPIVVCLFVCPSISLVAVWSQSGCHITPSSTEVQCYTTVLMYSKLLNRASGIIFKKQLFFIGFLKFLPEVLLSNLEYSRTTQRQTSQYFKENTTRNNTFLNLSLVADQLSKFFLMHSKMFNSMLQVFLLLCLLFLCACCVLCLFVLPAFEDVH